jgi:hypothetical protein
LASAASKRSLGGLTGLLSSFSRTDDDDDSFVSAPDTIADLADFDDLGEVVAEADPTQTLYIQALDHLERVGVPYRVLRTEFVGCTSDSEYLAKLHCLRQAFAKLMAQVDVRKWWEDMARKMLAHLLTKSGRDPKDFLESFQAMLDYLSVPENVDLIAKELEPRGVKENNFYDVALDYLLLDSFEVRSLFRCAF